MENFNSRIKSWGLSSKSTSTHKSIYCGGLRAWLKLLLLFFAIFCKSSEEKKVKKFCKHKLDN